MYAVLPIMNQHGQSIPKKKSLLILTNDFIIYYNLFNFFDQDKQKMIQKSLLMYEKLSRIVNFAILETQNSTQGGDTPKKDSESSWINTLFFYDITFQKTWKRPFVRDRKK